MRKLLLATTVFSAFASLSSPAFAWFDFGHMEVAAVAWKHMTPAAKMRATELLKLNPAYETWLKSVPASSSEDTKNLYVFMQSSRWADDIKEDSSYKPDGEDHGYKPVEPIATQNIGYSDHYLHKYWHFTDHPFSSDGTILPPALTVNAETQINAFQKALSSGDVPDQVKSYDLTWLIHLVGDVHQPLHCAMLVTKARPEGDAGGNKAKIECAGCPTNLHSLWDGSVGTSRSPADALYAADELPEAKRSSIRKLEPGTWTNESLEIAKSRVYPRKTDLTEKIKISNKYLRAMKRIADKRVALAGQRLALLLDISLPLH